MAGLESNMKNKQKLFTGFLVVMIVVLLFSIFYISRVLLSDTTSGNASSIAPRKTKAAGRTYSKLLAINAPPPESEEDEMLSVTPTADPTNDSELPTPTPTETILALQTVSITVTPTDGTVSPTSTTQTDTLPEAGFFQNTLILFAVSSIFLFVAFIF